MGRQLRSCSRCSKATDRRGTYVLRARGPRSEVPDACRRRGLNFSTVDLWIAPRARRAITQRRPTTDHGRHRVRLRRPMAMAASSTSLKLLLIERQGYGQAMRRQSPASMLSRMAFGEIKPAFSAMSLTVTRSTLSPMAPQAQSEPMASEPAVSAIVRRRGAE
jgi:hypothetical protein